MDDNEKLNLQAILLEMAAQIQEIDCGLPKGWFEEMSENIRNIFKK